MSQNDIGILLINTGTPDEAQVPAVRRYLREFLSDKRVIQLPRWLWLPILHGIVLRLRAPRSTKLYQQIWRKDGSPMRITMQAIADKLRETYRCHVEVGMNYGNPSIDTALKKLLQQNIKRLIMLPLYPQYSNTTTKASFDRCMHTLKEWQALPAFYFINHYTDNHDYIQTLAKNVQDFWQQQGRNDHQHLLISFHGIPKRYVKAGDPYAAHCELTAKALANALDLKSQQWTLCYQSRFGYDRWLAPATQEILQALPKQNKHHIDIVCPGFAVDCLETLEEIVIRGQQQFHAAGGKELRYIPALNAEDGHIALLVKLINAAT